MKLYERIENNNFDEIDRNRAIELIESGNGHLVYNENYFKLQKENEELKILEDDIQDKRIVYIDTPEFKENYISKQKVKDKLEELKAQYKTALEENSTEAFILKCQITILQELIKEEEEN